MKRNVESRRKETEKRRAKDIFHISCLIELTHKQGERKRALSRGGCLEREEDDEAR